MTMDEIMDREIYGSKIKQTMVKESSDYNWKLGYTSLDEFEGIYLSLSDIDRVMVDVMASTIIRRKAD